MTELARIFKALSDENRLAIFQLIRERGGRIRTQEDIANSISKIASEFDLSLSTVSHHIKELRNAGLVRCEKRGQTVRCFVDPEALERLEAFLG
ncbi:MAG: metalloregulator ArsR/SmtB family transcription factor [Actinomycetota bacterium]